MQGSSLLRSIRLPKDTSRGQARDCRRDPRIATDAVACAPKCCPCDDVETIVLRDAPT